MGLLRRLGATMGQYEVDRLRAKQAQQMAEMQNMAAQWLGQYSIGLASGTGTSNAAQSYVYGYSNDRFEIAENNVAPAPAKPKPGTYRRGKVPEGAFLYSESPLAWLEERVDEMRLVL